MAVMQRQQLGIREIGESVTVPQHNVARAMFYLKCICNVLDLNDENSNLGKFTDFRNYYLLSEADIDALTILIVSVKPAELLGKCLFHDEEICGNSNNKFFELEDVRQNMVIVNDILIAGQQRRVNRIMFFKMAWLQLYCLTPLQVLGERLGRRAAEIEARKRAITYQAAPAYRQQQSTQARPSCHTTSSCCIIL
ncbi:uncharacterized protein LOC117320668 [Pecten maximus]|uniref:uncharacterized protein LOC117320668 n=1 Tax=Pecten maximus TaxID=6579 RepID=UPI001458207C|nr:uncharacterized protein LOC117320668 [Pecten maximus]